MPTNAATARLDAFATRLGLPGTVTTAAFAAEPRESKNHALVSRERVPASREEYTYYIRDVGHTRLGASAHAARAALRRLAAPTTV